MLDDPAVDAVIVLFVPAVSATADEVAAAVARAGGGDKPVLAVVMSAEGIPAALRAAPQAAAAFVYPESAARALGRAAERADWLRRPLGSVPDLEVDRVAAAAVIDRALADRDDAWLEPADTRALLLAYGIPLVGETVAHSAEEAIEAAARLRLPRRRQDRRRRRSQDRKRRHRARPRATPTAVRAAVDRIGAPVIVQPMVRDGAELLAGLVQDPVFGPLVAFGPGGIFAELIGDAAFRIAPLTDMDAAGTGHDRQGRKARQGLSRRAGGRRRLPRRSRLPPVAPRRRPARRLRARPEPGARASGPLRRRRREHSCATAREPAAHQELVAVELWYRRGHRAYGPLVSLPDRSPAVRARARSGRARRGC